MFFFIISGVKLPPDDPGDLMNQKDVQKFLTRGAIGDEKNDEIIAGCVDALIVFATQAQKKKSKIFNIIILFR